MEEKKLSNKAIELRDLSRKRKFSENLHDYLFLLTENDDYVQQMLNYLESHPYATEDEVFEYVDKIYPPTIFEVEK